MSQNLCVYHNFQLFWQRTYNRLPASVLKEYPHLHVARFQFQLYNSFGSD